MADCFQCGLEVTAGTSFCGKCGTPVPAAPRRRLGPILGSIGGLIYVGVIAVVILGYVELKKRPHTFTGFGGQTKEGPMVPGGADRSNAFGVALYPGLKVPTSASGARSRTVTGYYSTDDSLDDVVGFYRKRYGTGFSASGDSHCTVLAFHLAAHDSAMITVTNHSVPTEMVTHLAYARNRFP